jgi:2-polyprenyl-6-hydroxyphenyl methylase/3-demethylubiquinone-9 3-methyltransferase
MIMKPPQPSPTWPPEVMAVYRHDLQEMWDRSIAPHVWNQYHNQLDQYLALAGRAPLDILDVGCAQGTLALLLAERGHRVTAVDLRREFLEYAQSRHTHGDVRFLQLNALEQEIPDRYDLVFANQLIEHLVYPDRLVARLKAALRPGGRLVVTTPNGDYLRNDLPAYRELGDLRQWEHLQFSADGDGHFFAYRAEELLGVFRSAGLQQVRAVFFETPWISGHMRVRHLHRWMPSGVLRALDRLALAAPRLGRRLAHQLLVTGVAPA